MTSKEAISIITQIKGIITNDNSWSDVAKATVKEAFDLAIKALEFTDENFPKIFIDYLNGEQI